MRRIGLVSAREARALDEDLPPLVSALRSLGVEVEVVLWDDPALDPARFEQLVLRSPWDYVERLDEFLTWCERAATLTRLRNVPAVVRWNTDKHYLGELEALGISIVPSFFVEPGMDAVSSLATFRARYPATEYVVKPSVGAGSRDAARYSDAQVTVAVAHIKRLQQAKRSVLLQPYLDRVDARGETALLYFNGEFSHAIRKGPLLRPQSGPTELLFATEDITPRVPETAEIALADAVVSAMAKVTALAGLLPLPYARIDLLQDAAGRPCLLELELTEPSLFFAHAEGSADRFARVLLG